MQKCKLAYIGLIHFTKVWAAYNDRDYLKKDHQNSKQFVACSRPLINDGTFCGCDRDVVDSVAIRTR